MVNYIARQVQLLGEEENSRGNEIYNYHLLSVSAYLTLHIVSYIYSWLMHGSMLYKDNILLSLYKYFIPHRNQEINAIEGVHNKEIAYQISKHFKSIIFEE